jgi:predicted TIM-barrel fold metal-dependent hydrolase
MRDYRLVSADSHVNEPPTLWLDRVPAGLRDRAPRIEAFEEGEAWVLEGALDPINFGGNCSAGLPLEERSPWIRWDAVRPGGYQAGPRLADQDADGVDAEVLYPTPRLANQVFWHHDDVALHLACVRAYNDWLAELTEAAPDRLWGVAMLPNVGVDEAVEELHRVTAQPGIRGVMIGQYPHGGLELDPSDDALWGALAEQRTPVSIHVAFASGPQGDKAKMKVTAETRFYDAPARIAQMVNSAVFDRFPELQLVLAEVDSAWLPYLAEQMDDRFLRASPERRAPIQHVPSEYFARNLSSTFINDRYGIANRHAIGVQRMMWSSDFPHGGSDWPSSRDRIEVAFAGVPDDERHDILAGNALRLYGARDLVPG